jgi:DnaJ-domain-containing protein 1
MSDRYTDDQIVALRRQLFRRIAELQELNTDCQNYALDQVINERMDTYFRLEERLEEISTLCLRIAQELDESDGLAALRQLDGRLHFIEDCFDEVESEIRDRPRRRRRRRFNFADFFRQWSSASGGQPGGPEGAGEIGSAAEAYRELGVTAESDARAIMAAFRRLVKELHPDTRGGDRSTEPRLRRIVAAYEFLKRYPRPES